MEISDLIARTASGDTLKLPSGEFEGPIVINKPLRLVGSNTTLWAKNGPVLEINCNGVTIEDLRIEITEGTTNDIALSAGIATAAKNVEVLGRVNGFGAEDGFFDVPRTIELGEFQSDCENSFLLEVNVPGKTEISCSVRDISVSPNVLKPGRNELRITVDGGSPGTLLYAELLFKSIFTRRIYLAGKPRSTAKKAEQKNIYSAPHREISTPPPAPTATDVISIIQPQDAKLGAMKLKRGQRVAAGGYVGSRFSIYFSCEKPRGVDVDPYIFLLDKDGRALGDSSLIFFGNERSDNGEALYYPSDGHIEIDLSKADFRIEKIVLAYAVYAADKFNNFSVIKDPHISIRTDSERLSFMMDNLSSEAAVVAIEMYLYKGEWKINAVGAGYNDGMARMCNSYGIDVAE